MYNIKLKSKTNTYTKHIFPAPYPRISNQNKNPCYNLSHQKYLLSFSRSVGSKLFVGLMVSITTTQLCY